MIILLLIAAAMAIMGIVILIGKLMLKEETMTAVLSFVALTSVACIIVVILANTWAKNK